MEEFLIRVDFRAKEKCILCFSPIDKNNYERNGNFCPACLAECNALAPHFPAEPPLSSNVDDIERWEGRQEYYERHAQKFQNNVLSRRLGYINH